jgi:flagellar motility protein MotE (MotC chaperone)
MPMPRLLPLVAVAAVGVLAINAVENGPGIIGAARSFAEGVSGAHPAAPAAAAIATNASSALPPDASANPAKPAPICAESAEQLAKDAGMSPAELQVIQSLSSRRGELDQREQGLSTELALIQAAEAKVDAKIATMNALKGDMTTLLGQLDDKQQAEVDRLVKVYEGMKPKDAAARFVLLSDAVRLPIAAKMKERALSAMLAQMPPADAKTLTELMAARYLAEANATRQALNPAPATPPPAAPPPPPPAQVAQATPPANPAATTAPATAATPPAHHAPPHRRPHPTTPPAGPALAANTPAASTPAASTPAATHATPAPPATHAATPAPAAPTTASHG